MARQLFEIDLDMGREKDIDDIALRRADTGIDAQDVDLLAERPPRDPVPLVPLGVSVLSLYDP